MWRLLGLGRAWRGRVVVAVGAGAGTTGAGIGLFAVSGYLIARASEHPHITALSIAVVAVRTLGISRGVFRYAERLTSHDVAFRVLADVRVQIYQRLERLAPDGLRELRSGDLLGRFVSDVNATQDLIVRGLVPSAVAALAGLGAAALCATLLASAAGMLALGLVIAGVLVPWLSAVLARHAGERTAAVRGELATRVTDTLSGAAELRAFGAEAEAMRRVDAADAELSARSRTNALVQALGAGLTTLISGITVWAVLVAGVSAKLGPVPLAVLVLTALASFEVVSALPAAAAQLGETRAAAGRITAVLDTPEPVAVPADPLPVPGGPAIVRLRGGRVRYEPDGPWALDGIDLDLIPGRRIVVTGPSGAGKSTLAAVLLRLTDLTAGTMTVNGADVTACDPDEVRTVIGGCAQDPHVFDTTIRENLRLARPSASEAELRAAARRAGLLSWIESLPSGWETPAGVHGTAMSGGERQRLALARAFLAAPAVLVLDEPAAHLDMATGRALMRDVLTASDDTSVVLITHDVAGLSDVGEIVVLDHGRVKK